jgi:hypothetical protein
MLTPSLRGVKETKEKPRLGKVNTDEEWMTFVLSRMYIAGRTSRYAFEKGQWSGGFEA